MLKAMLVGVTMIVQAASAAAAPVRPAAAAVARGAAAANPQVKARTVQRVKARTASATSTAAQQNAAVYIPRCYDCPM
jgi:hypothetical protein